MRAAVTNGSASKAWPSPGAAGAMGVVGGDGLQAHLFLCLAGPRALFAQQHVVPQEEIKPALKVQGTAKLCWEVAGARAGMEQWSGWPADSLPESQKEGGLQARAVWDKVDCWALARNAHERTFCSQ